MHSWREWYGKLMYLYVFASQAWLIVQIVQLYTTKNDKGLSVIAFALLIFNNCCWLIYGSLILQPMDKVILLNSGMSLIGCIVLMTGLVIY